MFCLEIPETFPMGKWGAVTRRKGNGQPQDYNWLLCQESHTSSLASVWVDITALTASSGSSSLCERESSRDGERHNFCSFVPSPPVMSKSDCSKVHHQLWALSLREVCVNDSALKLWLPLECPPALYRAFTRPLLPGRV